MYEVIETINLSKNFQDFWGRTKAKALDRLNLKIYRGEIFGLLGPNGSGKTTTVKLLLGLLFPTSGKIKILGSSPRSVICKKYLGFLPEESYLYPYQNAQEALFFYGRLFGLSRSVCKKRVDDLLDMVGLGKARLRPLKEFSKGMARRIGIAQALINDPEVVFLDEPTSGLDPVGTREIKDLILQLKEHGKTVFLCSHLLSDVEDICDKIAILYGGKIRCEGTVGDLLSKKTATQILLEDIPAPLLQELTLWLQAKGIKPHVEKPRERLETFFLNIIQQARMQQAPTSGAMQGIKKEDFFSQNPLPEKKEVNPVLAQLVQTVQEEPEELDAIPQEKEEEKKETLSPAAKGVLEHLVTSPKEEKTEVQPPPVAKESKGKKDILQKLLGGFIKKEQS